MSKHSDHNVFMQRAVELAWKGRKLVESNPIVGAVFVKKSEIIAEGYHKKFGGEHAEVKAIKDAQLKGKSLEGSTLYVTLEPCCHQGKQPPCTDALKPLGIKKVFYAQKDPNPKVSGQGIKILESSGIPTELYTNNESKNLNAIYLKNSQDQLPYLHIKTACTQDGKITIKANTETPLGNPESMKRVHQLRARYDGVLVGVNTVLIDDPSLTTRLVEGENPIRIIVDTNLRTPQSAQVFKEEGKTIIATTTIPDSKWKDVKNCTILTCQKDSDQRVNLQDLLKKLLSSGIRSILVEGGEQINTSFLKAGLADRLTLITCPQIANDPNLPSAFNEKEFPSKNLIETSREDVKGDVWVEYRTID